MSKHPKKENPLAIPEKWTLPKGKVYLDFYMDHFENFLKQDVLENRTPCEATYAECFR